MAGIVRLLTKARVGMRLARVVAMGARTTLRVMVVRTLTPRAVRVVAIPREVNQATPKDRIKVRISNKPAKHQLTNKKRQIKLLLHHHSFSVQIKQQQNPRLILRQMRKLGQSRLWQLGHEWQQQWLPRAQLSTLHEVLMIFPWFC